MSMTRIFVDVTRTASGPQHTGIQKVVRGLYRALERRAGVEDFKLVPIVCTPKGAVALQGLAPHPYELEGAAHRRPLRKLMGKTKESVRLKVRRLRQALATREEMNLFARALLQGIRRVLAAARVQGAWYFEATPPVVFAPGDVLILPDSSWAIDPWPTIAAAKNGGAKVVSVWYDLIPILYPEKFDGDLVADFKRYLERLLAEADAMVAISETVRGEIAAYARERGLPVPRLAHAWPGVELARVPERPRSDLARILLRPTVLLVSTLEPRKGHWVLLDAMEVLWARGIDANCLFIGRIGWNVEELAQRLRRHRERSRRLFHLTDASDSDVAQAYAHASVTAYPSLAEGLGLPIIEAELSGCPVVCTDIPVFREVAGPETTLFSPRTGEALADALAPYVGPVPSERRAAIASTRRDVGFDAYGRAFLDVLRALETGCSGKETMIKRFHPESERVASFAENATPRNG